MPEAQHDPDYVAGAEPAPAYQPPPIRGYRALSEDEVAAVNRLKIQEKAALAEIGALKMQGGNGERQRQLALAKTHIQEGFMWAVRAIADPNCLGA